MKTSWDYNNSNKKRFKYFLLRHWLLKFKKEFLFRLDIVNGVDLGQKLQTDKGDGKYLGDNLFLKIDNYVTPARDNSTQITKAYYPLTATLIESRPYTKEEADAIAEKLRKQQEAKEDADKLKAERLAAKQPEQKRLKSWVDSFVVPTMDVSTFSEDGKMFHKDVTAKFESFKKWSHELIDNL